MAFLETRISDRVTRECSFTVIQPARQKIYTQAKMTQAFGASLSKLKVDLAHGLRSVADFRVIQDAFYVVMFTPYEGLRVRNWADYIATQNNTTVRLLSGSTYVLQRRHTFGGVNFDRDITKPINDGTLQVFDAGGGALAAAIDYTDGTFTVSSGTPAKWSGQFDIPMTFESNEWTADWAVSTENLFIVSGNIVMEEIPVTPAV